MRRPSRPQRAMIFLCSGHHLGRALDRATACFAARRPAAHRRRRAALALTVLCFVALLAAPTAAQADHLWWAEQLVNNISPENNTYDANPSYVTWAGVGGATQYTNRTYCSGFLTQVLMQGHGFTGDDIAAWLGSTSPTAVAYHDAIVAGDGFDRISTVDRIAPGDILAIRYPEDASMTGHVAILQSAATLRVASAPTVSRTRQFEVWVADSSRAPHGPLDTRMSPDGTSLTGAGLGVMRLYADNAGRIVGHTWSTSSGSLFRDQSSYHVAIGRLR